MPDGFSLEKILNGLRQRNEIIRLKSAQDLRQHVECLSRELYGDAFQKYLGDIGRSIFDLISSTDTQEKLGGIVAIEALIDFDCEEMIAKIGRYSQYLRVLFPSPDPTVMIPAAKALGKLAVAGGTLSLEFVEFEVNRAIEWIQLEKGENRRYAGLLILTELGTQVPTMLFNFLTNLVDVCWNCFRDAKIVVRMAAQDCLRVFLNMISQRHNPIRFLWYRRAIEETYKGFKTGSSDAIHGSFLILQSLFASGGSFLDDYYAEICKSILKYRDHKEVVVKKALILFLPNLASFNPQMFTENYLEGWMNFLFYLLKKDKEKLTVYSALARLISSLGKRIAPFMDALISSLKDGLSLKSRNRSAFEGPIYECISSLVLTLPDEVTKYADDLIDLMFQGELTPTLHQTLVDFSTSIPSHLVIIQEKLLDSLSLILCKRPFLNLSVDVSLSRLVMRDIQYPEPKDVPTIVLCLDVFGNFNFIGHIITDFLRECARLYLDHDNVAIRKAAVINVCRLLNKDPLFKEDTPYTKAIMVDLLGKLLNVSVSDPEQAIRITVFQSLVPDFDPILAFPNHIKIIFLALNDEEFSIQQAAIQVIGRLTLSNPAYILPSLRKCLILLLNTIQFSSNKKTKEESTKLLSLMIQTCYHLIHPYSEPIYMLLKPQLAEEDESIVISILTAIGELFKVGGEQLSDHLQSLFPLLLEMSQDQGSVGKRLAALVAMGQLISNTGFVVQPLLKYPSLLPILVNILKTEQLFIIRREAVKLFGVIGAVDPTYFKEKDESASGELFFGLKPGHKESFSASASSTEEQFLPMDDVYATIVVKSLLQLLKDPSLTIHHTAVLQAILYIFKTLGLKAAPLLPQIMPPFLSMLSLSSINMVEYYYQQLNYLIPIIRFHLRAYVSEIVRTIKEHWITGTNSLQITLLNVTASLAEAIHGEFRPFLSSIFPRILKLLESFSIDKLDVVHRILEVLIVYGQPLEDYLHLIFPCLSKLFEGSDYPLELRKASLETMAQLCQKIPFKDHSSKIIHPLLRMMQQPVLELRNCAFEALSVVVYFLKDDFIAFIPIVSKLITKNRLRNANYDTLISKLVQNEPFPANLVESSSSFSQKLFGSPIDDLGGFGTSNMNGPVRRLPVNQQNLRKAWETSQKSTKDDWLEWMRRLSVELLRESPSHSLRACTNLASVYYPLSRELFNSAFVACWNELFEEFQADFIKSLELALSSSNIPPEIVQILLNLAEYLEHEEKDLPMDIQTLAAFASRCHAYAKALHYKEMEYLRDPSPAAIESLISINNQLQLPDAAIGVLVHAQKKHAIELQETWYEKLQRWDEALVAYERKLASSHSHPSSPMTSSVMSSVTDSSYLSQSTQSLKTGPTALSCASSPTSSASIVDSPSINSIFEPTLGIMRCLHALGDWDRLAKLAQETWPRADLDLRRVIAPLAAAASWGLAEWEMMDDYIAVIRPDTPNGSFFRAILALHRHQSTEASAHIERTRELLDTELAALLGESYNRAYDVIVRLQMLTELEEIMEFRKCYDRPKKQEIILKAWKTRLKGSQRTVDVWQRFLKVRSLIISPDEDIPIWIKFANLCRKNNRPLLAEKTLIRLLHLPDDKLKKLDLKDAPIEVSYVYLKHLWTINRKPAVFTALQGFIEKLIQDCSKVLPASCLSENPINLSISAAPHPLSRMLSRCLLRIGDWRRNVSEESSEQFLKDNLETYLLATRYDPTSYKSWHAWAISNFEALSFYERHKDAKQASSIANFVVQAIQGFYRSVSLSKGFSLQDTLRLLTLWFKYGSHAEVNQAISDGFSSVPIETWLQVIPQLIARIHAPNPSIRKLIHQVLLDVGKQHPQALLYSLTVASKSQGSSRKNAASTILDKMRLFSPLLVDQALLVSHELIRVAILWHEIWHAGLDEASRLYVGQKNYAAMLNVLEPLHQMIERGPETLREISFMQAFGKELKEAQEHCAKYKRSGSVDEIHAAWDLYYQIGRKIHKQLNQMTVLELQFVSPQLLSAHHLDLAVPGTYRSGEPIISIASFHPSLHVITSKQRPRRLSVYGSDGKEYQYLLKGHEDLRQDERVMQLFGLVNSLLLTDDDTKKRRLSIQRFPVIPLSPNSGLIGWVPHCDTVHALIKDYRETHSIPLNMEHRLMLQMGPDYEHMTLLQKMEVFEYALTNSSGQDLANVLWLKSKNSEAWLDRRTSYTRSLAVMSMVGYILGLGDRHPSNLMIDKENGKVIHIDFGDCFEVAMVREKYPERIPFRLTRMLISAMEVSGVEGTYRITSEHAMRVLRDSKDSLMAVLEAFVYDPLISWRLFGSATSDAGKTKSLLEDIAEESVPSFFRQPSFEDLTTEDEPGHKQEGLNAKALSIISRVSNKMTGKDFKTSASLNVESQVDRLINQATSIENLCQCYIGWCPFW